MDLIAGYGDFALGAAVGVLGLVFLQSLLVSYAYDEPTLLFLGVYLAVCAIFLFAGGRLQLGLELIQRVLLVAGPVLVGILVVWLLRKRTYGVYEKISVAVIVSATVILLGILVAIEMVPIGQTWSHYLRWLFLAWGLSMGAGLVYRGIQALKTAGFWKWWLMMGHAAGLTMALVFLTELADIKSAYWPVVLMLLVQAPPIYLALVWRSRLLNETRLRSVAANVADPLTGLAATPVLLERLMRITSHPQQAKRHPANSALYLIEVHNWDGLLRQMGPEYNEKLVLEAALRLRRSIGDDDLVARISSRRFAVVAQGMTDPAEVGVLATKLVVSGLRIDSPLLAGVELQFRVIVRLLKFSKPLPLAEAREWLSGLGERFATWPSSHRMRSILLVSDDVGWPEAGKPNNQT